jgi:Na+-driven multidrug efflux pump
MEKSKFVIIGSIIFVVTQISLIFLLGDQFGIIGIAWALVIAAITEAVFLTIIFKFIIQKEKLV